MFPVFLRLHLFGHEVPFHSYGLLMGLGILLACKLCLVLAQREGIPTERVTKFAIGVVLAGFVGGHLHSFLVDDYSRANGTGVFDGVGFTFYGASLSGMIAAFPVARILKMEVWKILDASAPGVPLAHGIGRIGCFLYGCCYGVRCPESAWYAVHYPRESLAWNDEVAAGLIPANATRSLPVVPTVLFEAGYELVLAALITAFVWRRPRRYGAAVPLYLVLYGPFRILAERYRDEPGRGLLLGWSTSTTIGIATAVFGLGLLTIPALVRVRPQREAPPRRTPTRG